MPTVSSQIGGQENGTGVLERWRPPTGSSLRNFSSTCVNGKLLIRQAPNAECVYTFLPARCLGAHLPDGILDLKHARPGPNMILRLLLCLKSCAGERSTGSCGTQERAVEARQGCTGS